MATTMTGRIDIKTVMRLLNSAVSDDGTLKTYGIRYVTMDGRIKEIYDASKNIKRPHFGDNPDPKGRGQYNLKYKGIVRLFDENSEEFRNAKLAHIIQFRNHNSTKWIDIFH